MAQRIFTHRIRTESDMAQAVEGHLNKRRVIAAREVSLGRCRFDVVAYDKNARVFKVVECKLHSRPASVGRTFGQAITYYAFIKGHAFDFLDAASRKLPLMRYRRWDEATDGGKKIMVAVYVALTDKACRQPEFLELRAQYPHIGIIRVKPNGRCRNALRRPDGTADSSAAEAKPKTIKIQR
jgi:hypothetical protein